MAKEICFILCKHKKGTPDLMFTKYEADLLCQNITDITTKGRGVRVSHPVVSYTSDKYFWDILLASLFFHDQLSHQSLTSLSIPSKKPSSSDSSTSFCPPDIVGLSCLLLPQSGSNGILSTVLGAMKIERNHRYCMKSGSLL